jgi:hypothetical protein
MVYVLDDERRTEITAKLRKAFAEVEGVDAVLGPAEYTKLGQPTPKDDPRAPDLWLSAKSGYSFTDSESGEDVVAPRENRGGTHGYLPDQPDMLGTLVISGYGVRPGTSLGKISNLDVAPTIARLLGIELPTADGHALTKALKE